MEVKNHLVITGNADGNIQTFDTDTLSKLIKKIVFMALELFKKEQLFK